MNNNCITTYTGRHIDPLHPDPDMICIEDIAHALSLICRGNGQVKTFFFSKSALHQLCQRSPCARIFQACGICLPSARCQRMLFI